MTTDAQALQGPAKIRILRQTHEAQKCLCLGKIANLIRTNAKGISYDSGLSDDKDLLGKNQQMATGNSVVTVGYIMKPSREEEFAKRGAFPLLPTQNGLIFMPLTFELPLSPQLQEVDIDLHKQLMKLYPLNCHTNFSNKIVYTSGMQDLQRYLEDHPDCCVIDSFNNIYPVLDRLEIQEILLRLEDLKTEGRSTIRGPHFLKVDSFKEPDLLRRLSES